MIESSRKAQRKDLDRYARGLRSFWHGGEDTEALAAGRNIAETLLMIRNYIAKEPDK